MAIALCGYSCNSCGKSFFHNANNVVECPYCKSKDTEIEYTCSI